MKTDNPINPNAIHDVVRENYARAASTQGGCCATERPSATSAGQLGYSPEEIAALPEGADLGLGCGNPQAIAALKPGETVLDLGSGAGFDCFIAARSVIPTGRVIGVDMTPDMHQKARANAAKANVTNVEFRLGQIEQLPVADNSIDAIISNCTINLSPDKPQAFLVRTAELPPEVAADLAALCGCVAGAASIEELEIMLRDAGFQDTGIRPKDISREFIRNWVPGRNAADCVVSATIQALKPAASCCTPTCCH